MDKEVTNPWYREGSFSGGYNWEDVDEIHTDAESILGKILDDLWLW